jgi:hypothetical protein
MRCFGCASEEGEAMTDREKLIETVAEAIYKAQWCLDRAHEYDLARAAIDAINASGTHRVVPVEPTDEMCMAAHQRTAGWLNLERHGSGLTQALMKARLRYKAMLDAAPALAAQDPT